MTFWRSSPGKLSISILSAPAAELLAWTCGLEWTTGLSTTLADLLTPLLVANRFSAIRASLRRRSSDEFEDGVAYGG